MSGKKSPTRLHVRVPAELSAAIASIAAREQNQRAAVVRRLLARGVEAESAVPRVEAVA